jgi:hypothetical protein
MIFFDAFYSNAKKNKIVQELSVFYLPGCAAYAVTAYP